METRHLKYFLAVAEELNFRKAAEKLFIAQPPLSRQIKELEVYLGVQLFFRNNRKVELTEAGNYLKEKGQDIMHQIAVLETTLPQIQEGYSGQLKIGYISSIFHNKLPDILSGLKAKFPQIKTRLYEMISTEQKKALEDRKLDIGIIRMPFYSKDLIIESLFKEPLALIYPNDRIYKKLSDVNQAGFILFNQDYAKNYHEKIIHLCSEYGFSPDIVHEANSMHSIINMVENGLGVSIVPSSIIQQYPKASIDFLLIKNSSTEIAIAYHRENKKPIIKDFIREANIVFN